MTTWVADVLGHGITLTVADPRLAAIARAAFPEGALPAIGHLAFAHDQDLRGPVKVRSGLHRWCLWSGGASGVVDCTRWRGRLAVGPDLAADPASCRYLLIEAACLFLATAYDRIPLHAAALVRDDRALLVAGPPGAGKSTLAWSAAQARLGVLAEDVTYLATRPDLRVYGLGRFAHLRPEVAARLRVPEIASRVVRAGGVDKIAAPLPAASARHARPAGLVWLSPGATPALRRLTEGEAVRRFVANVPGGFGRFRGEITSLAPRIAALGAWQLDVTATPESAVPILAELMDSLETPA